MDGVTEKIKNSLEEVIYKIQESLLLLPTIEELLLLPGSAIRMNSPPFKRIDVLNTEYVFGPAKSCVQGSTTKPGGLPQSVQILCPPETVVPSLLPLQHLSFL